MIECDYCDGTEFGLISLGTKKMKTNFVIRVNFIKIKRISFKAFSFDVDLNIYFNVYYLDEIIQLL